MINDSADAFPSAGSAQEHAFQPHQTAQQRLAANRATTHAGCVVCGHSNEHPPRVDFTVQEDQSVEATVVGGEHYEGYAGLMHGGVIATLLDAAMTNCLFARGERAVTADLHIRYRHPVASQEPAHVRAWLERDNKPLFVMHAELRQAGKLLVSAIGKFMQIRPDHPAEANLRS